MPFRSPLEGHIYLQLDSRSHSVVHHQGFLVSSTFFSFCQWLLHCHAVTRQGRMFLLENTSKLVQPSGCEQTMFELISGYGMWNRRYFVLKECALSYWNHPNDRETKVWNHQPNHLHLKSVISEWTGICFHFPGSSGQHLPADLLSVSQSCPERLVRPTFHLWASQQPPTAAEGGQWGQCLGKVRLHIHCPHAKNVSFTSKWETWSNCVCVILILMVFESELFSWIIPDSIILL